MKKLFVTGLLVAFSGLGYSGDLLTPKQKCVNMLHDIAIARAYLAHYKEVHCDSLNKESEKEGLSAKDRTELNIKVSQCLTHVRKGYEGLQYSPEIGEAYGYKNKHDYNECLDYKRFASDSELKFIDTITSGERQYIILESFLSNFPKPQ